MNTYLFRQIEISKSTDAVNEKIASPMSISNSPNLERNSLTSVLANSGLFSASNRMSVELTGALDSDEDTLEIFYAKTKEHVKHLNNIKLAKNHSFDFSSSMELPSALREAFPNILSKIQQFIDDGDICDRKHQQLLIYNYQHFSFMHETEAAYSLEMMAVDIHDNSADYTKGKKIINLAIFADGRITNAAYYLAIQDIFLEYEKPQVYGCYKQQGQGGIPRTACRTITG